MKQIEFKCMKCDFLVFKQQEDFDHDHCPNCNWSLHTNFSNSVDEPCFELMRPIPCTWQGLWPSTDCPMMWEYCLKCQYICLQPIPYIATPAQMEELTGQREQITADWLDPFNSGRGAAIWTMVSVVVARRKAFRWYRHVVREDDYDGHEFATRFQFQHDLKEAGDVK